MFGVPGRAIGLATLGRGTLSRRDRLEPCPSAIGGSATKICTWFGESAVDSGRGFLSSEPAEYVYGSADGADA